MFMYNRFLKQPIESLDFAYAKKLVRTPVVTLSVTPLLHDYYSQNTI
jgi:hypothetical protein